jgi:transcriptional regulator with XRE-family HTH domain
MSLKRQVGQNITLIRSEVGLTKLQLSKKAKINPSEMTRVEKGIQNLTLDVIERIAKALGVPPAKLLMKKSDGKNPPELSPDLVDYTVDLLQKSIDILSSLKSQD